MATSWREADRRSIGAVPDWVFDGAESAIPDNHRVAGSPGVVAAFTPLRLQHRPSTDWTHEYALLVCESVLVAARKSGLGRSAQISMFARSEFVRGLVARSRGVAARYEVVVDHRALGPVRFVFGRISDATDFVDHLDR